MGRFYGAFASFDCRPTHLALFRRTIEDLRAFVLSQDLIYVGGGNTANMLAVWRAHGLDALLRQAWERGIVLAGLSAGGLCWFEEGVTDSFGPRLGPLHDGLGIVPGSFCPHYDGEPERRPTFEALVGDGRLMSGWAADDGVALRFEGADFVESVSSRAGASAWEVGCEGGALRVRELPPRRLTGAEGS